MQIHDRYYTTGEEGEAAKSNIRALAKTGKEITSMALGKRVGEGLLRQGRWGWRGYESTSPSQARKTPSNRVLLRCSFLSLFVFPAAPKESVPENVQ